MAALRDRLGAGEAEGSAGSPGSSGVEVVLSSDPAIPAPRCPHGGSAFGLSLAAGRLGASVRLSFRGAFRAPGFSSTFLPRRV